MLVLSKFEKMYLLNEKIRSEEALRIGLVSKIIPSKGNEFQKAVHILALELAAQAPLALKRIKQNLVDADSTTFSEHLDIEAERHAKCGFHPDAAEAGNAFMKKRKGNFQGFQKREKWELAKL